MSTKLCQIRRIKKFQFLFVPNRVLNRFKSKLFSLCYIMFVQNSLLEFSPLIVVIERSAG